MPAVCLVCVCVCVLKDDKQIFVEVEECWGFLGGPWEPQSVKKCEGSGEEAKK